MNQPTSSLLENIVEAVLGTEEITQVTRRQSLGVTEERAGFTRTSNKTNPVQYPSEKDPGTIEQGLARANGDFV